MVLAKAARRSAAASVAVLVMAAAGVEPAAGRPDARAPVAPRLQRGGQQSRARRVVIGHSVEGRPIVAWVYGPSTAARKVLLIGVIHGNEQAGLAITSAERQRRVPRGVQLWIVPELNPDGVAADTRQNAHGVDLNRNFPYRWQYSSDPTFYSGPRPASEPETRAAMRLVERIHPAVTITYHQHMNLVDESGGDRGDCAPLRAGGRYASDLPDIPARRRDRLVQSRFSRYDVVCRGASRWALSSAALARQVRAVRAVELGQRSGSATRCDSSTIAQ